MERKSKTNVVTLSAFEDLQNYSRGQRFAVLNVCLIIYFSSSNCKFCVKSALTHFSITLNVVFEFLFVSLFDLYFEFYSKFLLSL